MYSIGYDVGSSSVKAALVQISTGETVANAKFPPEELTIHAPNPHWAEQDPNTWWQCILEVTKELHKNFAFESTEVQSIGVAYQMHGLVLLDENGDVLRPAIIWCDSRAIQCGEDTLASLGPEYCFSSLLNSPGNFTASKLKWVKENESDVYAKVHKVLLPGDFINYKLSGDVNTTISGLSEGIFWDFEKGMIAQELLDDMEVEPNLIPGLVPNVGIQSTLGSVAAAELGLQLGTPISYRAGDQPNNALALNVMKPGEIAATAGTSGVVYAVSDQLIADKKSRVNTFAHVNHSLDKTRVGVLLCINGTGIQYSWLRKLLGNDLSYDQLEQIGQESPIGSQGCQVFPFGNGAERMFGNKILNASFDNIDFNRHSRSDIVRATLEGIANSFIYGVEILQELGIEINTMKVGNDNLFQSSIFAGQIANVLGIEIEILESNGAAGAAKGAAIGAGLVENWDTSDSTKEGQTISPEKNRERYTAPYESWKNSLEHQLQNL